MDKLKPILEILKKNGLSILCALAAIAAVILAYYPTSGWYADLKGKLDGEVGVNKRLQGLLDQSRTLPLVDPDQKAALPLNRFPNQELIDQFHDVATKIAAQSKGLLTAIVAMNKHDPLLPGTFPLPPNDQEVFKFRDAYLARRSSIIIDDILNGVMPPTSTEVRSAEVNQLNNVYLPTIRLNPDGSQDPTSAAQVQASWIAAKPAFDLGLYVDRAQHHMIYVDPLTLPYDPNIKPGTKPTPTQMWNGQLQIWMQQDVARGIRQADLDPTTNKPMDILHAPIKRWYDITSKQYSPPPNAPVDPNTQPLPDIPIGPNIGVTGRTSNPLFDVIHFVINVDVEAAKVPQVLADFTRGQLITIQKVEMSSLDQSDLLLRGFVYGDQPCVHLTIECEDAFMRDWVDAVMPADVRKNIALLPAVGSDASLVAPTDDNSADPSGAYDVYNPPPQGR